MIVWLLCLLLSARFILVPAECGLRLISPDVSRHRRSGHAVVHLGTILAEAGVAVNVSTEWRVGDVHTTVDTTSRRAASDSGGRAAAAGTAATIHVNLTFYIYPNVARIPFLAWCVSTSSLPLWMDRLLD